MTALAGRPESCTFKKNVYDSPSINQQKGYSKRRGLRSQSTPGFSYDEPSTGLSMRMAIITAHLSGQGLSAGGMNVHSS